MQKKNFQIMSSNLPSSEEDSTISNSPLWNIDDVAGFLNVNKTKIYALTRETGKDSIPRFKIGKHLRFDRSEIVAWLYSQRKVN